MHADKIVAKKKKQSFLIKPQVLTRVRCFLEIHKRSPHHRQSKDIPFKMDTKNHGKAILILQQVDFFSLKIQDNQRTVLNSVCWIFDQ